MRTFKNASWMVICVATMIILREFHVLASAHLDSYGLYFQGIIWFLAIMMGLKGIHHGAEFFGNFDDLEFDIIEEK